MTEKEPKKKLNLNYEGTGVIRVKCECGNMVNLILNKDAISECTACKKESKLEIFQIEIKKGTKIKKVMERRKEILEQPKTQTDMEKVKAAADKVKEEILASYK